MPVAAEATTWDAALGTVAPFHTEAAPKSQEQRIREWAARAYKKRNAYGAKTTPQMYVINPDGILLYNGAIDDKPSARPESLEGATNYLVQAMTEAMAGQPVSQPATQPYGCSVKYKD